MAPSKLRFTVVNASGEDPDYPARELQLPPNPQTRGWQSPRFAKFPQEMTLQLSSPAIISQIQILSHEHKIAQRIEVYVGVPASGQPADPANCRLKRLGYLSFADNEASGFKARELKSVHVSTPAVLLRLVFHKCHVNTLNIYNQVGVIAVNIIGEAAAPAAGMAGVEPAVPRVGGSAHASANDIALDLNVDVVTAEKIREVLRAKQAAVASEEYDEAKRLKAVVDQLKVVGMKIAHLEAQKQAAVDAEDYDTAKLLKMDIEGLRSGAEHSTAGGRAGIHPTLSPAPLAAAAGSRAATPASAREWGAPSFPAPQRASAMEASLDYDDRPAVAAAVLAGDQGDPGTPQRFKAVSLDDQPAQALGAHPPRASQPQPPPPLAQLAQLADEGPGGAGRGAPALPDSEGFAADLPPPEPLSAAALKESNGLDEVVGEYTVLCLFSKNWVLRDAALRKLENQISGDGFACEPKEVFRTVCRIVLRLLKDKVVNVFHSALQLLRNAVEAYAPQLGPRETQVAVSDLIHPLLDKLGDSNARMKDAAMESLTFLASTEEVGLAVMAGSLVKPIKNQAQWRPVLGRLQLLADLVPQFGISKTGAGFPLDSLMGFVNAAFQSPNGEVRNTAVKLALEIYKKAGHAVEKFLPKDLKPAIKDVLTSGFAQIAAGEEPVADLAPPPAKPAPKAQAPSTSQNSPAEPPPKPKPAAAGAAAPLAAAEQNVAPEPAPPAPQDLDEGDEGDDDEGPADECQFCGLQDPKLAEGENMDLHFYHDCPMLCSCADCGQIIEIASVNEHLLQECESMGTYTECARCMEAVRNAYLEEHRARNSCVVAKPATLYNRCPLCHMDIPPDDEGWRKHLLEGRGCPANTRPVMKM